MTWIKICGITRREDAQAAAGAGADAIGFILWPGSPRYIEPAAAGEISAALSAGIERVGVFVDAAPNEIRAVSETAQLTMIQLHGDEAPRTAASLDLPVIKAFRQPPDKDQVAAWASAFALLADGASPGAYGGTGRPAGDDVIAAARAHPRLILAGGLTPETVSARLGTVEPWGIDASSGVETAPGIKDGRRIHALIEAVRSVKSAPARRQN